MDITSLKSGFWGYKKSSVCEYIAGVNEEFSHKIMDTLKDHDRQVRELNEKISQLEEENSVLREERDRVTKIITDAKVFSDELRAKSEAEDKKFRDSNMEHNKEQLDRINVFCENIDTIRDSVRRFLYAVDKDLSSNKNELIKLSEGLKELEKSIEVDKENEKH